MREYDSPSRLLLKEIDGLVSMAHLLASCAPNLLSLDERSINNATEKHGIASKEPFKQQVLCLLQALKLRHAVQIE